MKYVSLFSGIEAASCAWKPMGWKALAFAEIEPFPCAVLTHHYPEVPNHGDVTAFDWSVYRGECEVLVGGSPCQSFSIAGLRGSLADDRGNLALAFCKVTHAIDPRYVVYENVPGILSTKDNAFGCLLAGLVGSSAALKSGLDAGRWPDAGMVIGPHRSAAWRVLDAQGFVPQRRRRVFVVSCRVSDGINPGAVLFEPEADLVECLGNWDRSGSLFPLAKSVPRYPEKSREAGARVADCLTRGADSSGKGGYAGRRREDDNTQSHGAIAFEQNQRDEVRLVGGDGGITGSVKAENGMKNQTYVFQERGRDGGRSVEHQEDLAYSLNAPAGGGRRQELNVVTPMMVVRRLTPLEAERLMSFPDGWTAIPFNGKVAADGNRYRALGNSMVCNELVWIGKRIEEIEMAGDHARLEVAGWQWQGEAEKIPEAPEPVPVAKVPRKLRTRKLKPVVEPTIETPPAPPDPPPVLSETRPRPRGEIVPINPNRIAACDEPNRQPSSFGLGYGWV